MTKLTPTLKKAITADWHALLPQFSPFKPMWLARRVGPIVQGICLDRDSSNETYLPTLHVHCLCFRFGTLSLGMAQPLLTSRTNAIDRISVKFHTNHYREACSRLVNASLLATSGDWQLRDVLGAFDSYDYYPELELINGSVAICAWLGETKIAKQLAARYVDEARHWSASELMAVGGHARFRTTLEGLTNATDEVRRIAIDEMNAIGLTELPTSHLLA